MNPGDIIHALERHRDRYFRLADDIWGHAETGFTEHKSAEAHVTALKEAGFSIRSGVAGMPTAIVAEAGSGSPVIGILGEFDALSGLNQKAMALTREPTEEVSNGNGHGCGHHLLGAGAQLAAVAVKTLLEQNNLPGTIRFYGCPAEEGGFGKTFMARSGLFDDLDAALSWHPASLNYVWNDETLAVKQVSYRFNGASAHASKSPHFGRSALDAVELMNVGANYLREHIIPDARIHYAVTDSGGTSPNVVQPSAEVLYMLRAPSNNDVEDIYKRVTNVARGAALMTGCQLQVDIHSACSNIVLNRALSEAMHERMTEIGVPAYSDEELRFAEEMRKTLTEMEIAASNKRLPSPLDPSTSLYTQLVPLGAQSAQLYVSTDVGDVSQIVPTAQCCTACFVFGSSAHSWQWVSQGKSSIAHKGMLFAANTITATAIELFTNPQLLEAARLEFDNKQGSMPYACPLPEQINPPIQSTKT